MGTIRLPLRPLYIALTKDEAVFLFQIYLVRCLCIFCLDLYYWEALDITPAALATYLSATMSQVIRNQIFIL